MNYKITWDEEKNNFLKKTRNISFEEIEELIINQEIISIIPHHDKKKYPKQRILLIKYKNYIHYVPFIKNDNEIFLKTIIPSRKYNKKYGVKNDNEI